MGMNGGHDTPMGLEAFRDHVLEIGQLALREKHPEYVIAFIEAANTAAGYEIGRGRAAVREVPTPGFAPWADILLKILEVEIGRSYIQNAAQMLGSILPADQLTGWGMSQGSWTDHQQHMWFYSAQALLERLERLTTLAYWWLIKNYATAATPALADVQNDLRRARKLLDPIRNAQAHGGGFIEVMAKERWLEELALHRTWVDAERLADWQAASQERWFTYISRITGAMLLVIEKTAAALDAAADWDGVRRTIRSGR